MNYKITVYILCSLALIMSIIAICVAVYRTPELSFDYQGVLVGVLSLLVTALIWWQVWSATQVEKKIDAAISAEKSDLNKNIELTQNDAVGAALAQLGVSQFYTNDYAGAVRSLFNAIKLLNNGNKESDINKECWEQSIKALEEIIDMNLEGFATKDTIDLWVESAKLTNRDKILRFALRVIKT